VSYFRKNSIVLFALLAIFICPFFSNADTAADLQNKIDTQNQALTKLNNEIAQYQQQLTVIGQNKNTLNNEIKTLTLESQKLSASIKASQAQIDSANFKIDSLGASIQSDTNSITDLRAAIAKNLRDINEGDNDPFGQFITSQGSLSDVWHYIGEQDSFRQGMREKISELATTMQTLASNKSQVETTKKTLVALNSQLIDQHTINMQTQSQKSSLLASTKNSEKAYQALLAKNLAIKTQMESDIHDYESKLKFILNPSLLPPAGSSPFAWPLDHILITQLFGKTVDSVRLYATGTHNGVDFAASVGTPVKSMANGVVAGTGNSDLSCPKASYGKWVFIRYDNGLASIYGHLSLIKVTEGDRVSTGDVVAYSGSTGYATGPHLHVGVFANTGVQITSFPSKACVGRTLTIPVAAANAYLDPLLYLPKQQ